MKKSYTSREKSESAKCPSSASKSPERKHPSSAFSPEGMDFSDRSAAADPPLLKLLDKGFIRAKLAIGSPGDAFEREADRTAERVMRMSLPVCPECPEREEPEGIRTKPERDSVPSVGPGLESQVQTVRAGGNPLPAPVLSYFEPRFGFNFSHVRVHTDDRAAEAVRRINSRAFTLGRDIVFGAGQYAQGSRKGQWLLAHELTHVLQQKSAGPSTEPMIHRESRAEPSNLQKLDELLDRFDVPEEELIALFGRLSASEKTAVLAGGYQAKIAKCLNVGEMIRTVNILNPKLAVKLRWVEAAATFRSQIDYDDIRAMITSAPQGERDALKTSRWREFFVDVCTNETMIKAVKDLGWELETQISWIEAETLPAMDLAYSHIQGLIKDAPQAQRDALKTSLWRNFFVKVCTNTTIVSAVKDLGFDLATKLEWMFAEGTNNELIREVVATAPIAEVLTVHSNPVLSALLAKEDKDTNAVAERLAQEVLSYIRTQAEARAAAPPSIDPVSRFYKALKDRYLKDYLAAPSPHEGKKATDRIGKPVETRRGPADPNIIEVRPEGGAWRPAENKWEKGAELFWNKQKVPELPSELRDLPIFRNIRTLPRELAAGTGMLIRENLAKLPYLDVPFLLGVPNTSTATLEIDVIKGGKNLSQLMHWATGVKYSSESPKALQELFLAYEKWHLEGWDVFGQDALNDLIAEEQGRLLGAELQKGSAGEIKGEADLLPFLNRSFLKARAWVGALLRLRKAELDAWILSKEQKPAKMHWGALPEAQLWRSRTVYRMLAEGEPLANVKSSSLVFSQIEIYTLLFEADRWEAAHGAIYLTDLEKALVAGNLDAILAWKANGGGLSGAGAASEERGKLAGGA